MNSACSFYFASISAFFECFSLLNVEFHHSKRHEGNVTAYNFSVRKENKCVYSPLCGSFQELNSATLYIGEGL